MARLIAAIRGLARCHLWYGYRRIHARLTALGWAVNRKHVRRLSAALRRKRAGFGENRGTGVRIQARARTVV